MSPAPPVDRPPLDGVVESAEDLYEHAPCGYLSTALDGTIVKVNRTFLDWTGYAAADLVGQRRFADLLVPGGRLFYETHHLAQLERTKELRGAALDLVRHDGTPLPVLFSSLIVEPVAGGPEVIRTTIFDATQRRTYERELLEARAQAQESEQRLRTLHRIAAACAGSLRIDVIAAAVVEAAAEAAGSRGGTLWLVDEDHHGITRVAHRGTPEALAPVRLSAGADAPSVEAWTTDAVVTVAAGDGDGEPLPHPALAGALAAAGIEAVLHVPIRGEADVLGVFAVYVDAGRSVTPDDLVMVRTAAAQVGQALDRARLHVELEHQAHHDHLTGLPNRALLRERFNQAAARARRSGAGLAVLVIDLNGFKAVNDRFGHAAGDRLLGDVARQLEATVRPGDTVARLGGDEFAVLCEDADEAATQALATRIAGTSQLVRRDGEQVPVSVSVGSATMAPSDAPVELDELLHRADLDMYEHKQRSTAAPRHAGRLH